MDPRDQFCPNPRCPARGRTSQGNIKVHSYPQRRFRCTTCRKTFAATTGTPFYRLHKDPALFVCVVTLLAYGCPFRPSSRPSVSTNAPSIAGSKKAGGSANGSTNTPCKPEGRSWHSSKPMSCGCGSWEG